MASTGNTFTGAGTGLIIPQGDKSSSKDMNSLILQAQQLKYKAFKENEDEFLKNVQIDPVFVLSDKSRQYQVGLLNKFNEHWGQVMKQRGGNLSLDDKMQMARDKDFVLMEQGKMQQMQKSWEQEDALVKQHPLDYDAKEHAQKTLDFMTTGNFDYTSLPISAQSIDDFLIKNKGKFGQTASKTTPLTGNPNYQQTVESTGTRDEIAPQIANEVFTNPKIAKHMLQEWSQLDDADKNNILDTDKSGTVSPQEAQLSKSNSLNNPILNWYIDKHWQNGQLVNPGTPQRITSMSGGGSNFNWNVAVGGGYNRNASFPIKEAIDQSTVNGTVHLPDHLGFEGIARTSVDPRKISTVLVPRADGGYDEKPLNEAAGFDIITYSPTADVMLIKLKTDTSEYAYSAGDVIAVKGSEFDDLLRRKPFGIAREAYGKKTQKPRPY